MVKQSCLTSYDRFLCQNITTTTLFCALVVKWQKCSITANLQSWNPYTRNVVLSCAFWSVWFLILHYLLCVMISLQFENVKKYAAVLISCKLWIFSIVSVCMEYTKCFFDQILVGYIWVWPLMLISPFFMCSW